MSESLTQDFLVNCMKKKLLELQAEKITILLAKFILITIHFYF